MEAVPVISYGNFAIADIVLATDMQRRTMLRQPQAFAWVRNDAAEKTTDRNHVFSYISLSGINVSA